MDTEALKAMADRLQDLADGAEPRYETRGICAHICDFLGATAAVDFVCIRAKAWPEHSGNMYYPVPPGRPAYYGDNLWSGEYGAARRRLCGFLAQEIRKEIGDETN